jgi:hypothetical protein
MPMKSFGSGPHSINLSAAWLPAGDDPVGYGHWVRRFGRPAGLCPETRIWLVMENAAITAVTLNGRPLPVGHEPSALHRWEVTRRLEPRNLLELVVPVPPPQPDAPRPPHGRIPLPSACGRVRLEIEPRA